MLQPLYAPMSELLDRVVEAAQRRLGDEPAAAVEPYLRRYFAHVPPDDIREESPDTLFGAAYCHWRLAARRNPEEPAVRVYNPRLDEHGWRSEHTVVEIVTRNSPFLVASVRSELMRQDLTVHLVIHPMYHVIRTSDGTFSRIVLDDGDSATDEAAQADGALVHESFMHFEVIQQPNERLGEIADGVSAVLQAVRDCVEDWPRMRERLTSTIQTFEAEAGMLPREEVSEIRAFLQWLRDNHFTFLGYREYGFEGGKGSETGISIVPETGLGLLRDPNVFVFEVTTDQVRLPRAVQAYVTRPELLTITKADRVSPVHRPVPLDVIGIKRFGPKGDVIGHRQFVGLFTSAAYTRRATDIPILRQNLREVVERAGFDRAGHDGKALMNILETFPRDELLQVGADHLFNTAVGILHLQDRQRVALFLRRDAYDRFVAALVYIPIDRYNTRLRTKINAILERAFNGTLMSHQSEIGSAPLARLYVVVRTHVGEVPDVDPRELEAKIVDATRSWSDHLLEALVSIHGEEGGYALHRRHADAFPPGYTEMFIAAEAVTDVEHIEAALATKQIQTLLYRPLDAPDNRFRFKIYIPDSTMILSQALPMLEHLGLNVIDEVPHEVTIRDRETRTVVIHDFGVEAASGRAVDLSAIRSDFRATFVTVWGGEFESDPFNGLVLEAGLKCREVVIIRAYARYLRQTGIRYSQAYLQQSLLANPTLAAAVVALFRALFDPEFSGDRDARAEAIRAEIGVALDAVESADQDRIVRRFVNAVEATLRTNFFQKDANGAPKPYVSIKLDSSLVDELPLPRPLVEIFVYSPRVEGIHLRGGKVARGGLRWSDRPEDFRTEVLGLMKAQQVKNAVIVPVGSKGGFVVKRPPIGGDREAVQAEGVACYRTFIRGLLDLTDNRVGADVVSPTEVIRRDGDDPYLVVAADKGTATFSDIANAISDEYGFWLGDAFASGGANGYDHKKMGITAKGAWESVKRHFREMGHDTQTTPFTVIGVGDMSGDVFGNGMLLSPYIRLIGAFNHLHIFVDPDPDPAASFAERQRLFDLPRSSWSDYDQTVLSKGGAVFDRRAKTLTLGKEIQACLGITAERLTPQELIRALLTAKTDLLWFGGIGTYVKASFESHVDTGDRSNDAVRVDAKDLRAQVIGEGANLGVTQFGRIEFAQAGGRVNTDFIDNSAGVDCSDHEVNIKILLDPVVANGDMTPKQRNGLLQQMTDEVADLVLRDNYLQTQAITLIEAEGGDGLDTLVRLMRFLERKARLNRVVEQLPDEETVAERAAARLGLTRPEIAVLFSYSKIWLYDEVLRSDLPDDRHLAEDVVRYFPTALHGDFKEGIANHRLRRELIATSLTNSLINRMGGSFVTALSDKTAMPPVDVAKAYIIARDVFAVREIWADIEALDNQVAAQTQATLHREVQRLVERSTLWFLRHGGAPIDITVNVEAFRQPVRGLAASIASVLPEEMDDRIRFRAARYTADGVPQALAERVAYLIALAPACDIVRISAARGITVEDVAKLHFSVGEMLEFGWLRYQAEKFPAGSHWETLAVAALIEEMFGHQHDLTLRIIDAHGVSDGDPLDRWSAGKVTYVERTRAIVSEMKSAGGTVDLSMLTVASRALGALAKA